MSKRKTARSNQRNGRKRFRLNRRFLLVELPASILLVIIGLWYLTYVVIEGATLAHWFYVLCIIGVGIEIARAALRNR